MDTYIYTTVHEKAIRVSLREKYCWREMKEIKYRWGDHTCTPEDVVAVTDLKSQRTKATRYVLIFTLTSNWSSSRPSPTSTVLTWNTQITYCSHFLNICKHVWHLAYRQHSLSACWTGRSTLDSSWSERWNWLWSSAHQNKGMPSGHSWAQSELKLRFWKSEDSFLYLIDNRLLNILLSLLWIISYLVSPVLVL